MTTSTKSGRTRTRILDAAAAILAEQGYGNTRLEDIASEAGIKTGSLYYYFGSREELVETVLEVAITRVSDAVRTRLKELPKNATYREKITAAIETQLEMALQQDTYTAASFRITTNLPPALKQRQIEMQRNFGKFWRNLLEGAQKAGEIHPKYELSVLRMLLLGSINWSIEWYRPGPLQVHEIATQLSDMFFEGVSPKDGQAVRGETTKRQPAYNGQTAAKQSRTAPARRRSAIAAAR